jgi:SAM-dependent methyltransferase
MRLHDGTELSDQQIEELNAHGPYSMAIWRSGDVSVGNEEGLAGRSAYFTSLIRQAILKHFSRDEIKGFSILDIGCNDGWVLHQLSDLPFAKMVGIEPREKNIAKGRKVREVLKLKNRVDYRVGDIESLGGEQFDIVVCAGVLYHVESIPLALRSVHAACRRMVFIESRCISSKHITRELMDEIEMRDLVYQFKQLQCGVTAQKFESAYHDGSARVPTIVNVPTTESLAMNLSLLGFEDIEVVADPDTYRAAVWQEKRPLGGVCITGLLKPKAAAAAGPDSEENRWIADYERGLEREVLPRDYVEPLYRYFSLGEKNSPRSPLVDKAVAFLATPGGPKVPPDEVLPPASLGKFAKEIVQNWRYSLSDKIALEYGKVLAAEGRDEEAIAVLSRIASKLNADWRAVYRSFHLLSAIYQRQKKSAEAARYRELALTCNPRYPIVAAAR